MKILPKKITKKGFNYTQLKREGMKAIYKQTKDGQEDVSFEAIKIGSHNGYELGGQKIPAGEAYPSTSQWGTAGWTYKTLEEAERKYKKIKE